MTIIHNTNIERLMRFNPNKSFYYFIAIKRKKDHPELQIKDSQVIKTWIVKDIRDFYGYYIPEMLEIVKLHQCRLYICTDRKSYTKSMLSIRNDINKQLDCAIGTDKTEYSPKILNNLLQSNIMKDESSDKNRKKWLFDVDTQCDSLKNYLMNCFMLNHYNPVLFKTKSGYHVVTDRCFNAVKFVEEELPDAAYKEHLQMHWLDKNNQPLVELKENAMVLVAMGE